MCDGRWVLSNQLLKCFSCGIRDQSSLLSSRGCSQENEEDGIYEESIEFRTHVCTSTAPLLFRLIFTSSRCHQKDIKNLSCLALCVEGEDFTRARPAATTTSLNVALLNPEPVPAILFSSLTLKTVDPPARTMKKKKKKTGTSGSGGYKNVCTFMSLIIVDGSKRAVVPGVVVAAAAVVVVAAEGERSGMEQTLPMEDFVAAHVFISNPMCCCC